MSLNKLSIFAVGGIALFAASCHKDHPAPEPDPCLATKANPLTFRFLESFGGTPTPDTSFTNLGITFDGPGAPYTRYEWQVGTDPRAFAQRRFSLHFPDTDAGRVAVRLIAYRPANLRCFPNDDGIDTLTKTLTLVRRTLRAPIYGKFLGSNADAPRDTFTVRVFSAPNYLYPNDPAAAPYDYLRNLGRGCQSYHFTVNLAWRGISFNYGGNDFGCLTESGAGYLTTRDSIRIDYAQNESDSSPIRVNRVFRGRRVR